MVTKTQLKRLKAYEVEDEGNFYRTKYITLEKARVGLAKAKNMKIIGQYSSVGRLVSDGTYVLDITKD